MMNYNEQLINSLACGVSRDNMVFENCGYSAMVLAYRNLVSPNNDCVPLNISLKVEDEALLQKLFNNCEIEYKKVIMAECYVNSLIMLEIMKKYGKSKTRFGLTREDVENGLLTLKKGNFDRATEYYVKAPMASEVSMVIRKLPKVELNVFLFNTKNKYLQLAINKYLASREPYSVKVFASGTLPTYYVQGGQFIQPPHDYISFNLKKDLEK